MIHNPILRGFHPDPSIIRAGTDYYIATSTFEWWPGVRIHHSRDLVHWSLIGYPLTRMSQMDLRGVGPSQGIWAPCLTYDNGVFYLVYTIVKAFYCNMYDTENYLVTAEDIHGPWSEPVALNNFGFDPSLFHDDDGRKYMVSMVTDHRVPKKYAGRLVLQEFDAVNGRMTGPVKDIYRADGIFLEGPHIFKRNGWYYLFSADTGTGEAHGQTIQRARDIWGPYEMYRPEDAYRQEGEAYSILTSRHHEDILLQKAGHCDLVETPEREWYMVHLCGRRYAQRAGETTEIRVYSNQPSVKLFLNGKEVEEKTADKVFVFTVALEDGFNTIVAQAGNLKDTMTLEKVEKEPAIYVLPEVNERAEGVANWFSVVGDMDLKAPMEFPEGKYSVKDSMEEIAKCPEAMKVVTEAIKLTMNMKVVPGEGMWDMMKSMNLEKIGEMAGSMVPEGFVESLNAQLIQIDREQA